MMNFELPMIDWIAAATFFVCWFGYGQIARFIARSRPSLMNAVKTYRRNWIERMCARENHTADATLLSNLLRGALFFASTTVFILGGLSAVLGTAPKVAEILSHLPYTTAVSTQAAELKALVLILLYIYAFFKFTWSAWQYNVLSILVGAMPSPGGNKTTEVAYIEAGARVAALAGDSYNNGIRAYYFSIPLMAWLLHPLLCLAATIAITVVLYQREFHSPVLHALQGAYAAK